MCRPPNGRKSATLGRRKAHPAIPIHSRLEPSSSCCQEPKVTTATAAISPRTCPNALLHNTPSKSLPRQVAAMTLLSHLAAPVPPTGSAPKCRPSWIAAQRCPRNLPRQRHSPKLRGPATLRLHLKSLREATGAFGLREEATQSSPLRRCQVKTPNIEEEAADVRFFRAARTLSQPTATIVWNQ